MTLINLAYFLPCTDNEGPGKRAAVWVQGCHFDCVGCCNSDLQEFKSASLINIDILFEKILQAKENYDIEGVTFVGGEPMLQAKGLSILAERCQKAGLSVLVFTGFTFELLKIKPILGSKELLSYTDLLIDGLYLSEKPEKIRNWCGSINQNFHYLSDRYENSIETDSRYIPKIEIAVDHELIRVSGYPL